MLRDERVKAGAVAPFEAAGRPVWRDTAEDLRALERTMVRWLAETGQPQPLPGVPWGKYRIDALLEEGGMGRVYRAWDHALRRPVALKCLRAEDSLAVERLMQEARAQARVDHEHVCKVYEVGEVNGHPYIALQLIEGRTLKEAAGGLSLEQKVRAVIQVAAGVEAAHGKGLVHRDLKPDNILIESGGRGEWRPFLVDFGIASDAANPHLTRTGMVVGSLAYMAPERLEGAPIDRRVDIWGLGATLYELFAGDPPFAGGSEPEVLRQLMRDEVVPLSRLIPGIPRDLEAVIMKCLERDPERRYATALELAGDLERFLAGLPVAARPAAWWRRPLKRVSNGQIRTVAAVVLLKVFTLGGLGLLAADRQASVAVAAVPEGGRQEAWAENELRRAFLAPLAGLEPEKGAELARLRGDMHRVLGDHEQRRGAHRKALAAYAEADEAYTWGLSLAAGDPGLLAADCRLARAVARSAEALGLPDEDVPAGLRETCAHAPAARQGE